MKKTKVFVVCSGLGNIMRGYESFTQECFDALSKDDELEVTLFKGGGVSSTDQIKVWNLPRNLPLTQWLGAITENLIPNRGAYWIEQITFGFGLLPHVVAQKPEVILFSDFNFGNVLWLWRKLTGQNYKLLFSNGAPWVAPVFSRWDRVQQVVPVYLQAALELGEPPKKHSLVPYGVQMRSELVLLNTEERKVLRQKLGLPVERSLMLSVGGLDTYHKRMDYVIREVANLPEPRPYLVLLGQPHSTETPVIQQLANELLGSENFWIGTVTHQEMAHYYQISDAFTLASLGEGFGRVFLEAMSYGLPCLAHDYAVTQFIFGDTGFLGDFSLPGTLSNLIPKALAITQNLSERDRIHSYTYEHFSWEKLRPAYVKLIQYCANYAE
jgi:1,2-diacylglycerol 3-alpha-glucosyltransferase